MKKLLPLSIALVGLLFSACSNLAVEERSGFQGTGHITKSADDKGVSEFALSSADLDNYINYKKLLFKSKGENNKVKSVDPLEFDGDTLLYIFNFDNGWEIISADKRTTRVVSHCDIGNFSIDECIPAVRVWIEGLASDIAVATEYLNTQQDYQGEVSDNIAFWNLIAGSIMGTKPVPGNYVLVGVSESEVLYDSIPHLITTQWHQGAPFNRFCPLKTDGINRAPAGCVAIAGAQMTYFLHNKLSLNLSVPDSAYCHNNVPTNNPQVSYYNWSSSLWSQMATNESNAAGLIMLIGQMIGINYTNDESTGYIEDLKNDFFPFYNIDCDYCNQNNYDSTIIINQLNAGMPLIAAATDVQSREAHAFIIDRYKRYRVQTRFDYVWEYVGNPTGPLPYVAPYSTYSYGSPYIKEIGMNWGWYDGAFNDWWFTLFSTGWHLEGEDNSGNPQAYDFDDHRVLVYNFN